MPRTRHTHLTILTQLQAEYHELETLLDKLNHKTMEIAGVQGEWSVKEAIAHLTEWDKRGIQWISTALEGRLPHIPAPNTTWSGRHRLNKATCFAALGQSIGETLEEYRETFGELLELLDGMDSDSWYEEVPYIYNGNLAKPILMVELVRWRLNHLKSHRRHISAYVQRLDEDESMDAGLPLP